VSIDAWTLHVTAGNTGRNRVALPSAQIRGACGNSDPLNPTTLITATFFAIVQSIHQVRQGRFTTDFTD
jgi:hypothetical protein